MSARAGASSLSPDIAPLLADFTFCRQTTAERNVEIPEFDKDEEDTILASHKRLTLGCFPRHIFSFFLFFFGLACVNHLLLALQCKPLALKKNGQRGFDRDIRQSCESPDLPVPPMTRYWLVVSGLTWGYSNPVLTLNVDAAPIDVIAQSLRHYWALNRHDLRSI